jgi:hypothetical protein
MIANKKAYLVMEVERKRTLEVLGREIPINMCWYKGMIGVMAVFATREEAEDYTDHQFQIIEIELQKDEP